MEILRVIKSYKSKEDHPVELEYRLVEAKLNNGEVVEILQYNEIPYGWANATTNLNKLLPILEEAGE